MGKPFEHIAYQPTVVRRELRAFAELLKTESLSEQVDILPFFKKRKQLAAFIGTFAPNIGPATELAYEFPFLGDFKADIVIGNRQKGHFCVVEFEDGRNNSVFAMVRGKATREWSRRFEHGFSQLVDWFFTIDDYKKTNKFKTEFGDGHIAFLSLLVAGRNAGVSDFDRTRLKWRTEKVRVDSHTIEFLTFDDLYQYLATRIAYYPQASKLASTQ